MKPRSLQLQTSVIDNLSFSLDRRRYALDQDNCSTLQVYAKERLHDNSSSNVTLPPI